ncbi:hypothetical protein BZG36_01578 [Bifiguratus adelaidae]|uniref:Uncharacterized protein n=1 Tax=Bifiguratus adelaidae TaxID=1938954 RepID=A0A261Y405_9FUNG|nr:hypothetical protein BZG36_01578 [Bifiguratus adelaidae]
MPPTKPLEPKGPRINDDLLDDDSDDAHNYHDSPEKRKKKSSTSALVEFLNSTGPEEFQEAQKDESGKESPALAHKRTSPSFFRRRKKMSALSPAPVHVAHRPVHNGGKKHVELLPRYIPTSENAPIPRDAGSKPNGGSILSLAMRNNRVPPPSVGSKIAPLPPNRRSILLNEPLDLGSQIRNKRYSGSEASLYRSSSRLSRISSKRYSRQLYGDDLSKGGSFSDRYYYDNDAWHGSQRGYEPPLVPRRTGSKYPRETLSIRTMSSISTRQDEKDLDRVRDQSERFMTETGTQANAVEDDEDTDLVEAALLQRMQNFNLLTGATQTATDEDDMAKLAANHAQQLADDHVKALYETSIAQVQNLDELNNVDSQASGQRKKIRHVQMQTVAPVAMKRAYTQTDPVTFLEDKALEPTTGKSHIENNEVPHSPTDKSTPWLSGDIPTPPPSVDPTVMEPAIPTPSQHGRQTDTDTSSTLPSSSATIAQLTQTIQQLERKLQKEQRSKRRLLAAMQDSRNKFEVLSGLAYRKLRELWEEKCRREMECLELEERCEELELWIRRQGGDDWGWESGEEE